MTFELYENKKAKKEMVTLYKGGLIEVPNLALSRIGNPPRVDLLWDADTNSLGIKENKTGLFGVNYSELPATRAIINAQKFMRHFNILGIPARSAIAKYDYDLKMLVVYFGEVVP